MNTCEKKGFTASEMAAALEITIPSFYSLMKKLELDNIKKNDSRGRKIMYFTYNALARCREELKRREAAENIKLEITRTELEAAQAEHPLVTDPRFLKLSYFPNIIPACFEEAE